MDISLTLTMRAWVGGGRSGTDTLRQKIYERFRNLLFITGSAIFSSINNRHWLGGKIHMCAIYINVCAIYVLSGVMNPQRFWSSGGGTFD